MLILLNNIDQNQNSSDNEVRREGREREKIGKEGEGETRKRLGDLS